MKPELSNHINADSAANNSGFVVVGREPPVRWWFIPCFLCLALVTAVGVYQDPQASGSTGAKFAGAFAICFWFAWILPLAWWLVRRRVVADENGLHWRGMGGSKRAAWTEVADYYIKVVPGQSATYIVETSAGKLDLKDLTHNALLRQVVQERARWAQSKKWEERIPPNRSTDLSTPAIFTVDESFGIVLRVMLVLVVIVLPAVMLVRDITKPFAFYHAFLQTWHTIGPWWAIGAIVPVAIPALTYGSIILALWPSINAARERRGQTITVSDVGITWRDTTRGREVHAKWDEINDLYLETLPGWVQLRGRYVLESRHGSFDFVSMCSKSPGVKGRLPRLIQQQCALHGLQREWYSRSQDRNTNVPGKRVFSYRYSEVAVMLWGLVAFILVLWILVALRITGILPGSDGGDSTAEWPMAVFFFLPMTLAVASLVWTYFSFAIEVDDRGITERNGRKTRFIEWKDVREYETSAGWSVIRGELEAIRLWNGIGKVKDLKEYIVTHATASLTRSW